MSDAPNHETELDRSVAARLAKLAGVPVDVSGLQKKLNRAIAREQAPSMRPLPLQRWPSLAGAAAAMVLVAASVWIILAGNAPAVAAPIELAQLHEQIVSGAIPMTPAANVDEANRKITAQSHAAPRLPGTFNGQVKSCCPRDVKGALSACVLMEHENQPVTLVVARAKDLGCTAGRMVNRDGRQYTIHEVNGLQMVMCNIDDRWLCVMGQLPEEQLLAIAAGVRF